MNTTTTNPRFCAFAHSRGMSGQSMQAHGFKPHEFMAFIRQELGQFCRLKGRHEVRLGDRIDHEAFSAWLLERYPEVMA